VVRRRLKGICVAAGCQLTELDVQVIYGELRTLCRVRNATLHQRLAALTQAGRLVRSPDGYRLATTTA
jgi:hypothetical protein